MPKTAPKRRSGSASPHGVKTGRRCSQFLAKGRQVMVIDTVDARAYR
ncbi:MAG: hypothetical protein U0521_16525 [Anaerolineae bacterium]